LLIIVSYLTVVENSVIDLTMVGTCISKVFIWAEYVSFSLILLYFFVFISINVIHIGVFVNTFCMITYCLFFIEHLYWHKK
jgi:hypothetical protein